MKGKLIKE